MDEHVFQAIEKIFRVLREKETTAQLSDRELIYVTTKLESLIDQYGSVEPEASTGGKRFFKDLLK